MTERLDHENFVAPSCYLQVIIKSITSVLFTIGGARMNILAFSGTNFFFSFLVDDGEKEHKRHDFALEKLQ